jgi:glycosyltransferase involved in cell wall biosynthesis
MGNRIPVSVCMATFNGERYVLRQIETILGELSSSDELIVVDDCSTDRTVDIVRSIQDPRISVHRNASNQRQVRSFATAIGLARNDILFLADQDDIWTPGRVDLMCEALDVAGAALVASNFEWIDEAETPVDLPRTPVKHKDSRRFLKNIFDIFVGRPKYLGCTMAFRREFVSLVLPIPAYSETHDLWLALAANLIGSHVHLEATTLRKRHHQANFTDKVSGRSLYLKLKGRLLFARSLFDLSLRRGGIRSRADLHLKPKS